MGTTPLKTLATLAAGQRGLFTAAQGYALGLSRTQLHVMVERGRIVQLRRGVYLMAGTPPSPEHPVLAAILAAGDGVVASHRSAAALWGLKGYLARGIDVTSDRQVRLAGVTVHRAVNGLPKWQRKVRFAIPVTSAARTLVDLATKGAGQPSTKYKLEKAWDDAERRNLLTDDEVGRCVGAVQGVGQDLLDLLHHRVAPCDGDLAKQVLQLILQAGIAHPHLEYEVNPAHERNRIFRLDMAWPAQMVAVEVEGWEAHRQRGPFDHDADRESILVAEGWSILPVTSRTKARLPTRLSRALAARTMAAS